MAPDRELLEGLSRLMNSSEFRAFRAYLNDMRNVETHKALFATENSAAVMRGRAQKLTELVNLIETAPQELERLEKRNGPKKS